MSKSEWQSYFDRLSRQAVAEDVSVLVQALDLGVQPEFEQVRLLGITYDHADDALEIATPDMVHRIPEPSEVWVCEDATGGLSSLRVTDGDGREQIVELRPRVELRATG